MRLFNSRKRKQKTFEKIDVALKSNRLYAFLMGIGIYKLDAGNMNETMILNTGAIMVALYEYCKEVSNISDEIQNSLEYIATLNTFDSVYTVLEIALYQLEAQKNNISPFELNIEKILVILQKNISENKGIYTKRGELGDYVLKNGMMKILIDYDKKLKNGYN